MEPFIELEGLLNEAIQMHPKASDNIKSALRDLGLKVHLKEEWTGTEKLTIKDWRKNNALFNSSWYFQYWRHKVTKCQSTHLDVHVIFYFCNFLITNV